MVNRNILNKLTEIDTSLEKKNYFELNIFFDNSKIIFN